MKLGPFRGLLFAWRLPLGDIPALMAATTILLTKPLAELHILPGDLKALVIIEAGDDADFEADAIIGQLIPHIGNPVSWDVVDPKTRIVIA